MVSRGGTRPKLGREARTIESLHEVVSGHTFALVCVAILAGCRGEPPSEPAVGQSSSGLTACPSPGSGAVGLATACEAECASSECTSVITCDQAFRVTSELSTTADTTTYCGGI
ncbi:MAG: hypothetical protein HYV07_17960 [Deltaproteobacteria bacterium]|nr:hypothetical protein [Deltaproteobacteria bacterium]